MVWLLSIIELPPSDWVAHQHRDTYSSIVGHPILTSFLAIAGNDAIGRVKFEMTEVCELCELILCFKTDWVLAYAATLWTPAQKG